MVPVIHPTPSKPSGTKRPMLYCEQVRLCCQRVRRRSMLRDPLVSSCRKRTKSSSRKCDSASSENQVGALVLWGYLSDQQTDPTPNSGTPQWRERISDKPHSCGYRDKRVTEGGERPGFGTDTRRTSWQQKRCKRRKRIPAMKWR
jgi:hypothetical protein